MATEGTKRAFLCKCSRRVVGSAYGQALNSGVQVIDFLASGPLVLMGWEGAGAMLVKFAPLLDTGACLLPLGRPLPTWEH